MGNSVRSTLGNLCGGEQAAKESPDDEDRPVSKPKDIKKKEKNKKKNKKDKEKNGDLTLIKEENEPEKLEEEKPSVEDKADNNTDATKVSGDEVEGEERKPSGEQKKISTSGVTLLEKSAEANIPSTDPITYVIENIAEDGEIDPPSLSSTPRSRKETFEIRETKTPVNNVEVEDEEHNTLDFGKYIFIDPSTGDIQTMRNRSRSLDSLCSMTSNRSSIGRFGSFELVTDFEINIAEKNQENKMAP